MSTPDTAARQSALKDAFRNDFLIGAALSVGQITGNEPNSIALVKTHCNSITPENILKWEEVHPEPNRYNFDAPDRYVAFGERHGMHIIGHTLVWHWQTPGWVFADASGNPLTRNALLMRMKEHISSVMGRYKGRIHGWDVVNEAVMADGSLRKSEWLKIIGEDYIVKAFEFAREADPTAELYYNDYDYEYRPKCDAVIRLVENLQAKGCRVDGVGIQGHWFMDFPKLDELETYVRALERLKVKLMITELDIGVVPFCHLDAPKTELSSYDAEMRKQLNPYPNGLPEDVQAMQAKRYAELFAFFRRHRDAFKRITFWGVHDAQTWRSYLPIGGRSEHPLLFDQHCRPKPALDAILKVGQAG
jgi:endo-1,4-beta-xylanase